MKSKRRIKPVVRNTLLIILIFIFVLSVFKIVLFFRDMKDNKDNIDAISDEVIDDVVEDKGKRIIVDFDKLLAINSDTVGWIRFNNNKVNNPIVHTKDNSYYLRRSFNRSYNQAGTIFMDYRNKSLNDKNVVLFGHSMLDGTMFGSLKDVYNKGFFDNDNNNYIQIVNLQNGLANYQIFSYYTIEKEEYYITTSFDSDDSFSDFIKTIKERSYKDFDVEVTTDDNILTLSTCSGLGDTSKRQVIHAKKIENEV